MLGLDLTRETAFLVSALALLSLVLRLDAFLDHRSCSFLPFGALPIFFSFCAASLPRFLSILFFRISFILPLAPLAILLATRCSCILLGLICFATKPFGGFSAGIFLNAAAFAPFRCV